MDLVWLYSDLKPKSMPFCPSIDKVLAKSVLEVNFLMWQNRGQGEVGLT